MTGPSRHANAAAGEVYAVLPRERADRDDLRLVLDLAALHHGPPGHVHPHSDETFTVIDGALDVRVGRRWATVTAGRSATAPAGSSHAFRNTSGRPVRAEVLVVPGDAVRAFFTDLFGLVENGYVDRRGQLPLPVGARLLRRHPAAVRLAGVPGPVQSVVLGVLSALPSPRPDRRSR